MKLWIFLIACALPALAESPFAGVWKLDLSQTKFTDKPIQYRLADGTFSLPSSDPPFSVPADGADHPVAGHPAYDSVGVRVIDDHTAEVTRKRNGKPYLEEHFDVSPDGLVMVDTFVVYPQGGKPLKVTAAMKRAGKGVEGAHAMSGSWIQGNTDVFPQAALTLTILDTPGGGAKISAATGEHYEAGFDGKEYPYEGDPDVDTVVLKRPENRVLEEALKRGGQVQRITRMTVSDDGTTLTMDQRDKQGAENKFVWRRQ